VTEPNSLPRARSSLPVSSCSSVGNGPPPTRVQYAFEMPTAPSIFVGGTPVPVHAPPAVVLDEVTNGYVPWSTSSSVPCAPSNSTEAPPSIHRERSSAVSVM
jgi:hypothetical protein